MTRERIMSLVCLIGAVLSVTLVLWIARPETAQRTVCQAETRFANVLTDLYTANLYETLNPRAFSALQRQIPNFEKECESGCSEDLRVILDRLKSMKMQEVIP